MRYHWIPYLSINKTKLFYEASEADELETIAEITNIST